MATYSLSHLSDYVLMRELAEFAGNERCATAGLLARIAEVDARKLYLPAAYPSMFAYCVHELRLSEDSAFKRITAARTARQYPVIFEAVAEGQLHLTAVGLLAPYLRPENADELLKAVAHKTKPAIEQLIAERFPRPELLALVEAARAPSGRGQELAPERVGTHVPSGSEPVPEPVVTPACRSKVAPHAPGRRAPISRRRASPAPARRSRGRSPVTRSRRAMGR